MATVANTTNRERDKDPLPEWKVREALEQRREDLVRVRDRYGLTPAQARFLAKVEAWLADADHQGEEEEGQAAGKG
jgi:hypothetical protein